MCLRVCVNHISVCTVGVLATAKMLLHAISANASVHVCMCVCTSDLWNKGVSSDIVLWAGLIGECGHHSCVLISLH